MMAYRWGCCFGLMVFLGFYYFSVLSREVGSYPSPYVNDRVVVSAPFLIALFGGDRFLAANMEVVRLSSTGVNWAGLDAGYLSRAQLVVSDLNACHEDNYYLANGLLSWGGADRVSSEVLRGAMECRFWDELPAFFYGFNVSFFDGDRVRAVAALNLAADRAKDNAAAYRKLAIMLEVDGFEDEKLALDYLVRQRDLAYKDLKLQRMLDRRVKRLQGLVLLREAQRNFESKYGRLSGLENLIERGFLQAFPDDPLGLGYELKDRKIVLKRIGFVGGE